MLLQYLKEDYARQLADPSFRVENKVRLNLSDRAYAVLLDDMDAFRAERPLECRKADVPSYVINRIFHCFRERANASAALALSRKRAELETLLAAVQPDSARSNAIQLLMSGHQAQIAEDIARRSKKGKALSFRLDKDSMEYLSDEGQKESDFYDDNVGRYVKAVIEEYSELPYVERERIWYKDFLDTIALAVVKKKTLKLVLHSVSRSEGTDKNNVVYLKPLGYRQDSELLYNYVVGMTASSADGPWSAGALRLTSVKDCKCLEQAAFISEADEKRLEEAIEKNGVQYLSDTHTTQKIVVAFTSRGERLYRQLRHLRPMYTAKLSPLTYVFDCTLFQAETYFFKFGQDAKIIEPESLAEKFRQRYYAAAAAYSQTP